MLSLVSQHRAALRPVWEQLRHIQSELVGDETSEPSRRGLLVASALAAGFTFCLVPAACGYREHPDQDAAADVSASDAVVVNDDDDTADIDAAPNRHVPVTDVRDAVVVDAARNDASSDDAREASVIDATPDVTADAAVRDASGYSEEVRWKQEQQLLDITDSIDCPSRLDSCDSPYAIAIDAKGRVVDIIEGGNKIPQEVRQCYLDALAGETFPCLAGDTIWQECVICLF